MQRGAGLTQLRDATRWSGVELSWRERIGGIPTRPCKKRKDWAPSASNGAHRHHQKGGPASPPRCVIQIVWIRCAARVYRVRWINRGRKPYPYRDTPTPDAEGSASARLAHWLYKPSIHDGDRDHSMPFWVEADRKDRFCVVFSSFNYSFDQYRPAKISMRKTGRLTQLICLDDRSCEVRLSQTRGL